MKSRSIRILLVDDSPKALKVLSQILAREERVAVVGSATNGAQALRCASALAPELVLIGLHLSKLNGAQATSRMKRWKNPPVVFMTASDESPSSRSVGETAGADAFVATSTDLEVRLKSILQKWFSPNGPRRLAHVVSNGKEPLEGRSLHLLALVSDILRPSLRD